MQALTNTDTKIIEKPRLIRSKIKAHARPFRCNILWCGMQPFYGALRARSLEQMLSDPSLAHRFSFADLHAVSLSSHCMLTLQQEQHLQAWEKLCCHPGQTCLESAKHLLQKST